MAAWLYEGVLLFGVVFMAGLLFIVATPKHETLAAYRHAMQVVVGSCIGAYLVVCWSRGQTLAMKTWRIRVVDARGGPVKPLRALWRFVLCWVWVLPPLEMAALLQWPMTKSLALCAGWALVWALSSRLQRQRQFWHDIWSGTRLIDAGEVE
jgi:uncharacterized RDD family membrane protein YckC